MTSLSHRPTPAVSRKRLTVSPLADSAVPFGKKNIVLRIGSFKGGLPADRDFDTIPPADFISPILGAFYYFANTARMVWAEYHKIPMSEMTLSAATGTIEFPELAEKEDRILPKNCPEAVYQEARRRVGTSWRDWFRKCEEWHLFLGLEGNLVLRANHSRLRYAVRHQFGWQDMSFCCRTGLMQFPRLSWNMSADDIFTELKTHPDPRWWEVPDGCGSDEEEPERVAIAKIEATKLGMKKLRHAIAQKDRKKAKRRARLRTKETLGKHQNYFWMKYKLKERKARLQRSRARKEDGEWKGACMSAQAQGG
ncbi:hypothetical protein QBC40DRAFT_264952 [Triangularia verruculosa]|uniref:Uncharacterized protein n=1 Tax=Triangularia verruculosa TaxID=2587418 RepID=A0AAN7AVC6_9PEZI|nr:hypothetical protein QBC40DRAFT_264952 [Triangularia verruculosa]